MHGVPAPPGGTDHASHATHAAAAVGAGASSGRPACEDQHGDRRQDEHAEQHAAADACSARAGSAAAPARDLANVLAAAEAFVRSALARHDGSHDWWHVARVRATAVALAEEEGLPRARVQVVELAALLHDVEDWKYSQDMAERPSVEAFLTAHACDDALMRDVAGIIATVGFKDELAAHGGPSGGGGGGGGMSLEARVVQDADRLDAIGAIGVARCFTFGGAFKRMLHDPDVPPRVDLSKEQYTSGKPSTTRNHFDEKLVKLKDMMKTESGRAWAASRHAFMCNFLTQFDAEWVGAR